MMGLPIWPVADVSLAGQQGEAHAATLQRSSEGIAVSANCDACEHAEHDGLGIAPYPKKLLQRSAGRAKRSAESSDGAASDSRADVAGVADEGCGRSGRTSCRHCSEDLARAAKACMHKYSRRFQNQHL